MGFVNQVRCDQCQKTRDIQQNEIDRQCPVPPWLVLKDAYRTLTFCNGKCLTEYGVKQAQAAIMKAAEAKVADIEKHLAAA